MGQFLRVLTRQRLGWLKSYATHCGNFDLKIVSAQLFTVQRRCLIDNLADLLFSREKVIATQVLIVIATGRYSRFKDN